MHTPASAPGIGHSHDDDGRDGPPGHPDLIGFGENGRVYFWLRYYAANVCDPDGYSLEVAPIALVAMG